MENKKLSFDERQKFAKDIAGKFAKFDELRQEQITTAKEIMAEVYLRQAPRAVKTGKDWKSNIHLNLMYSIKNARLSQIWRDMWADTNAMFTVRGTNEQTEKTAKQQKAALVDALDKMEIGKTFDSAVSSLFDVGEIILKTDWETREKTVKRQRRGVGFELIKLMRSMTGAGYVPEFEEQTIPYYENARVENINPIMFVFDTARWKLRDQKSWDSVLKIYKRFDSLDNIKANPHYEVTQEMLDELKEEKDDKEASENKKIEDIRQDDKFAGEYSILFAHGDFKINGKIYKNYIAEVLAGRYLIRFEPNPVHVTPFILCAVEFDPKTKRGISPLKACMGLCKHHEELVNTAFDVQKLLANPPCWCHEDLLDGENVKTDGTIPVEPGKYLKVSSSFNGSLPQAMNISGEGLDSLIGLLEQKISDISNVSSVMYGNIESEKRTATELSLADKGSSAQSSKILDIIYQDLTIPMIKNVAEILAMFKTGNEFVYAQEKGVDVEHEITPAIREAQYQYIYEDRNALFDYNNRVKELYQICQGAFQLPELAQQLDSKEIFTMLVETLNIDNVEKLFKDTTPAQQFSDMVKQLPQEVQPQIIPALAQQVQQYMQNFQQNQRMQQMQQQAQEQVQMQQMRDNARAEIEAQAMGVV
ncbi:MAG: hypothetical protein II304_03025 [Bacteroidales bacterium]|nr:hypothetical protein [Bacteroidales bacterium]